MTIFISVLLSVLFLAYVIALGIESERRDHYKRDLFRRWRGLGAFGMLFTFFVFSRLWASGSAKEQEPYPGAYEILREQVMEEAEELYYSGSPAQQQRLSTNQCRAGFALTGATNNATAWSANPETAILHSRWTLRGAADDTFWLPATNWSFVLGTNAADGVHVSSDGTLSFWRAKGTYLAAEMPDGYGISFLAPLQGSFGTVPREGSFWHAATSSNSVLLTWSRVFAGRDADSPVTFQAELFWNGDFTYRYAFTNALSLTNFAVGAQHNGGGETYALNDTDKLVNGLELHWRAFGILDPGVDDHDGDGLSTYDEVMFRGTDPRLPDSDFDGIPDSEEVAEGSSTSALNPDTDGDGLADGIDPQPAVWNDPDGDAGGDGLGYLFEVTHGLDPAADNALDSDGDGWADWKELMAGTATNDMYSVPVNIDGSQTQVPVLFEATVTLNASLPCNALLRVGDRTVVLRQAGSYTLTLVEGVAYPVSVIASQPCTVSLSATLNSQYAAFQDPGGVFSGGAAVPGGKAVACGMIAQPTLSVTPEPPERVCFHSAAPKTVAAKVSPPMAGSYQWCWYGGDISSVTGRSANISWDVGDSPVSLYFTAAGAAEPRYSCREVTKCSKADEDTWCGDHACEHWYCACDNAGAADDDDCGFHGQKVSKCRESVCPTHDCPYDECPDGWCHRHAAWYSDCGEWWCHWHECYLAECGHNVNGLEPGETTAVSPGPGEPVFGSCGESLATVNNDDDDASSADDTGENPVEGENDLVAVWPLGYYDGQCCPCPAHEIPPAGSQSAELETCSARLAIYGDACKSNAFGATVHAGEAVRVEGLSASTAVGADRLVWKWTDAQSHVHRVTNAFTVLSVRLFGDVDLDGGVDATDKALHPALTNDCGWGMPAATNVFRPVRLRTDVGLSGGVYTLSLSGDGGFRVWCEASGTNAPLLVCGQTVTNGAGGITFLTGADTDLYVEAVSNSTATLIYTFAGTGVASNISCSASIKMTAYRVTLEPVTVEANGQGTIVNPCGVAVNGLAAFRVRVEPSADIPDSAIHWSVASGGASIYSGHGTGREAIIKGGATESDFKLEVDVDGLPLAVNPYIYGRVLEPKTVPVRAYVICDSNGVPAVTTATINGWIVEANRIYRQVAVTFTLAGVTTVTDHHDWFEINNDAEFYQMTSYTNGTGGLELYCVNFMISGAINGLHSDRQLPYGDARRGMAVRADAPLRTLAHESGHACGLPDLYAYGVVAGLVSEDKVKPLNWSGGEGTGFYSAGLLYRDVMFRSLMHNHDGTDIPLDCLTGIDGGIPVSVSAGLNQMSTREPQH